MNPIIKLVDDDHVIFELTDRDRKDLRRIKLVEGGTTDIDDIMAHRMCIMQAVSLVITPEEARDAAEAAWTAYEKTRADKPGSAAAPPVVTRPTDKPICVSEVITKAMVRLNDREGITPRQRARLKKLVEEILNTCPVKRSTKQLKTKVKITERRDFTPAYRKAEEQRREILGDYNRMKYNDHRFVKYVVPFSEMERRIRKAAAVR